MELTNSARDLIISKSKSIIKDIVSNMDMDHTDIMTDSFIKTVTFCLENDLIYEKDKDEIYKVTASFFSWTSELETEYPADCYLLREVLFSGVCKTIGGLDELSIPERSIH